MAEILGAATTATKYFLEVNQITIDNATFKLFYKGGFQLEFVSISRVINNMTCYNFECSQWWKIDSKKIF